MINYIKISREDYYYLENNSGYYVVKYPDGEIVFFKNKKWHREDGAAYINDEHKQYYLSGKFYGNQNDYTDESWIRFIKLKAFI